MPLGQVPLCSLGVVLIRDGRPNLLQPEFAPLFPKTPGTLECVLSQVALCVVVFSGCCAVDVVFIIDT